MVSFPLQEWVNRDPVRFPRWFLHERRDEREIEAIALFSAMLAYGKADLFMKVIERILKSCDYEFLDLTLGKRTLKNWPSYRLSRGEEIASFVAAIGKVISWRGSIQSSFRRGFYPPEGIFSGLSTLYEDLYASAIGESESLGRGIKHLLPDPQKGSCSKRWHLFLRWMVRPYDKVDLGLWKFVSPSKLIVPLDRHISQTARALNLTSRSSDDRKTAEEITQSLRAIDPDDPVRFDFALCHLGMSGNCSHDRNSSNCETCILVKSCFPS
ncbi:TIGR02757 family protein [bacterium]|nr:TIGR02757 family protein [bacterium]